MMKRKISICVLCFLLLISFVFMSSILELDTLEDGFLTDDEEIEEANEKSLVFRVVDKRLIEMTGGIVQGMSGSPIMQDGKIVGVVTHVFTSDATKVYGVYVDWMI